MGGVNYYHYSVYKVLVVNLVTRFAHVTAFEKKSWLRNALTLSNRLTKKPTSPQKKSPGANPAAGLDRIPASTASPATWQPRFTQENR
jgi:hypothetical protein